MHTFEERQIIYESYDNFIYGYHVPKDATLHELNNTFNEVVSSVKSKRIKRRVINHILGRLYNYKNNDADNAHLYDDLIVIIKTTKI